MGSDIPEQTTNSQSGLLSLFLSCPCLLFNYLFKIPLFLSASFVTDPGWPPCPFWSWWPCWSMFSLLLVCLLVRWSCAVKAVTFLKQLISLLCSLTFTVSLVSETEWCSYEARKNLTISLLRFQPCLQTPPACPALSTATSPAKLPYLPRLPSASALSATVT